MSTNTEQEKSTVESPSNVSNETEHASPASSVTATGTDNHNENQTPAVENQPEHQQQQQQEQEAQPLSSSWFTGFGISPNLTSQLTNLSSSFMQVTSKVGAVATTLVQKTLPQRPSSPNQDEETEVTTKSADTEQTSDEFSAVAGINKDITSTYIENLS